MVHKTSKSAKYQMQKWLLVIFKPIIEYYYAVHSGIFSIKLAHFSGKFTELKKVKEIEIWFKKSLKGLRKVQ